MEQESYFKESRREDHEMEWKNFLLCDEPLSFEKVKKFTELERPDKWPSNEDLLAYLRDNPREAIRDAKAHRPEIESHGGNIDEIIRSFERFKDFEGFEIKRLQNLKHWNKIKMYLEKNNLASEGIKVIIIDNEEYWKNFYGSNPSKSVAEMKTIILKKELFECEDISEENLSWIVHEIGHLSFYDFLDDKKDEYMREVRERQKYAATAMESIAFQEQLNYLKSLGKTREDCLAFMESYVEESFGPDENSNSAQKKSKQREMEQLMRYVNDVFGL